MYEILRNQIGSNPQKIGLSLVTLKFCIAFLTFLSNAYVSVLRLATLEYISTTKITD